MPCCVVRFCTNYDTKVKKEHGISYHRFPTDPIQHEKWSRIVRIQRNEPHFKPHFNARVCSAHFWEEDVYISKSGLRRLNESALPRLGIEICENENNQTSQAEVKEDDVGNHSSIIDTPTKTKLMKRIMKLENHRSTATKKIRNLHKKISRLKKKNNTLLGIIKELQHGNYITDKVECVISDTDTEESCDTLQYNLEQAIENKK